jgi:predicted SprT family Zn-dependent metalloprotease
MRGAAAYRELQMTDSEITVHSHVHRCGICEQLSAIGVDLESTNRNGYDNFVCALCHQKLKAAAQLKAAQVPVT